MINSNDTDSSRFIIGQQNVQSPKNSVVMGFTLNRFVMNFFGRGGPGALYCVHYIMYSHFTLLYFNTRFNRGALINIGYLESRSDCDHICMHDVDTIPNNTDITYPYPERGPFHVSSPDIHPRNHYFSFIGGILIIRNEQFREVKKCIRITVLLAAELLGGLFIKDFKCKKVC